MKTIRGKPATALFVVSFAVFVDLIVYGLMIPVLAALLADALGLSDGLLIAGGVVCACGVSMLFVMRGAEMR